MAIEVFWNKIYQDYLTSFPEINDPVLSASLEHFGNIKGAKLLDIGCGNGSSSIFFARQGANVTAIDISEVAIDGLSQFCQEHHITNIKAINCSAFEIAKLGEFDFVFGNMILHHLEPFNVFSDVLKASLNKQGKAFFHENNAFSKILVWCRNNLVGKYGIPKYGDDDEFPLMPQEIALLSNNFSVRIVYPELLLFRLFSAYLLKSKLEKTMKKLDDYLFRFSRLRQYSYRQYLLIER